MLGTGTLSRGGVKSEKRPVGGSGRSRGGVRGVRAGRAETPANSTAPVTMEIWHPWDPARAVLQAGGCETTEAPSQRRINAALTAYGGNVLAPEDLSATAAGTAPPMAYLERQDFLAYALKKLIEPLDTLIKQEKITLSDYYDGDIKNATYQGKLYLLPAYVGQRPDAAVA